MPFALPFNRNNNGNILTKKIGNTMINYAYDGDKLVSYNGQACVYDAVGNPTTYRGKVYLVISKEERQLVAQYAATNAVKRPWFTKYKNVVRHKPQLVGTAHFMHETARGGMRQPVWKGLRE